jgi:hypothetical protein
LLGRTCVRNASPDVEASTHEAHDLAAEQCAQQVVAVALAHAQLRIIAMLDQGLLFAATFLMRAFLPPCDVAYQVNDQGNCKCNHRRVASLALERSTSRRTQTAACDAQHFLHPNPPQMSYHPKSQSITCPARSTPHCNN